MRLFGAVISLLVLGLAGCGSPSIANEIDHANRKLANENSPFRWESLPLPGGTTMRLVLMPLPSLPTSAGPQLKADIVKALGQAEVKAGRSGDVNVKDVKPFETSATLVREVWLVESAGRTFAYVVLLRHTPDGATELALEAPREI